MRPYVGLAPTKGGSWELAASCHHGRIELWGANAEEEKELSLDPGSADVSVMSAQPQDSEQQMCVVSVGPGLCHFITAFWMDQVSFYNSQSNTSMFLTKQKTTQICKDGNQMQICWHQSSYSFQHFVPLIINICFMFVVFMLRSYMVRFRMWFCTAMMFSDILPSVKRFALAWNTTKV